MLKLEVDDAGVIRDCSVCGDSFTVAAEVCGAICNIYHVISQANVELAEEFRFAVSTLTAQNGKAWDTSMLRKIGSGFCCYAVPRDEED